MFTFDNTFARELDGFGAVWEPQQVPRPQVVRLNVELARSLGLDPEALHGDRAAAVFAGAAVPVGAAPRAQVYAGHQFGSFNPQLGDGRAVVLGEIVSPSGRRDIALKGSGRTPFSRGGDGKAALGPVLREYLMGEAMHALGIPTTRALAVATTGETVRRDTALPGAVLTRVASSHLRVGSFQFFSARGDVERLGRLVAYAIDRHDPDLAGAERPSLALLDAVVGRQASLIARWMNVGFIHGVMNTDNVTVSGETIDYGPCAFLERFDPTTVFSSIDHGGRYAYGNQPSIGLWNAARLAEALLPLVDPHPERAVELATGVLDTFQDRYDDVWLDGMRSKLGLDGAHPDDRRLADDWLGLLHRHRVDLTTSYRRLADAADVADGETDGAAVHPLAQLIDEPIGDWTARWRARLAPGAAERMNAVNPVHVPRNHLVEAALDAATAGDPAPFDDLLAAVTSPFHPRPGHERLAEPATDSFTDTYRTYCGT